MKVPLRTKLVYRQLSTDRLLIYTVRKSSVSTNESNAMVANSMHRSFTEGPVGPTLAVMTSKMFFGAAALILFGTVDAYFISLLGTTHLAAASFIFPVCTTVANLSVGFSIATTAIVAKALGGGDYVLARRITVGSLFLCCVTAAILAALGFLTLEPLFRLLGATAETIELIASYMHTWYLGSGVIFAAVVGNGALRATGDSLTPSIIMVFSGLLNAGLDPLLIFGWWIIPPMGIQGAAIATVVSWGLSLIAIVLLLTFQKKLLGISLIIFHTMFDSWKQILIFGLPAAVSSMLMPMSIGIITAIVADYGSAAVAGYGVGIRIEALAVLIPLSLTLTLSPFLSQNVGARTTHRIEQAIMQCFKFSLIWQFLVYIILALASDSIARLFSNDLEVQAVIKQFVWIVPLSYGCYGVILLTATSLNALHEPLLAAGSSLLHLFLFYLPLAKLGAWLYGLQGLLVGLACANIIASFVLYIVIRKVLSKRFRTYAECHHISIYN